MSEAHPTGEPTQCITKDWGCASHLYEDRIRELEFDNDQLRAAQDEAIASALMGLRMTLRDWLEPIEARVVAHANPCPSREEWNALRQIAGLDGASM